MILEISTLQDNLSKAEVKAKALTDELISTKQDAAPTFATTRNHCQSFLEQPDKGAYTFRVAPHPPNGSRIVTENLKIGVLMEFSQNSNGLLTEALFTASFGGAGSEAKGNAIAQAFENFRSAIDPTLPWEALNDHFIDGAKRGVDGLRLCRRWKHVEAICWRVEGLDLVSLRLRPARD